MQNPVLRAPCLMVLLLVLAASAVHAVTIDWVTVPGTGTTNACDPQPESWPPYCYGSVAYTYLIGKYEVTNAQYAEFLNAVAASDPYELYHTHMANDLPVPDGYGGITRSGSTGSYTYSAIAGRESMPVIRVSWYDSLRFANWLNNGQGSANTETGAYTLLGGTPIPSNWYTITRNADARIVLANEGEWYKAAYYDALSQSYFDYPAGSDTQTTCALPGPTANTANCGDIVGDLTDVGSYTGSAGPYGTFDQGGNVREWMEDPYGIYVKSRGGEFGNPASYLSASSAGVGVRGETLAGIRLVFIPEPSTALLLATGLAGLTMAGRWRSLR